MDKTIKQHHQSLPLVDEFDEGIISNEPSCNKYPKILPNRLDQFPYFLIGKITTSFNTQSQLQGVGIMIGPNVVLTAAHILCQMTLDEKNENRLNKAFEVLFDPCCTENFYPLNNVVYSQNFFINERYLDLLQEKEKLEINNIDKIFQNDWAIIFLPYNVGDHISKLLDVDEETKEKLKVNNGLYDYFHNTFSDIELLKLDNNLNEISLIAYTEGHINLMNKAKTEDFYKNESEINSNIPLTDYSFYKNNQDSNFHLNERLPHNNTFITKSNIRINSEYTNNLCVLNKKYESKFEISMKNRNKKFDFVLYKSVLNNDIKTNFKIGEKMRENTENISLTMGESKGFLFFPENTNENYLYYKLTTFKGQSGAPLFIRVKKNKPINDHQDYNNPSSENYTYYFVGIHIKRESKNNKLLFKDVQESKEIDSKNSNLKLKTNNNEYMNEGKDLNLLENETKLSKLNSKNQINGDQQIDNLNNEHDLCEYNISLKLTQNIVYKIFSIMRNITLKNNSILLIDNTIKSNYVMINLFLGNQINLKALFYRNTELSYVFKLAGKILNIKKKFTFLEIKSSEDIKYRTYNTQIYEYDKNKKINDLILEKLNLSIDSSFSLNNSEYCINFDIGLNISLYSDFLCERILNKVAQNENIDLNLLKKNPIIFAKFLAVAIFAEIKDFKTYNNIFGDLFLTLKNKLGIK